MSSTPKTNSVLPFYHLRTNKAPVDGIATKTSPFCQSKYDQSCQKFYKSISSEGYYCCPYGFAVRAFRNSGHMDFFSSISVNGISDAKKLRSGNRLPEQHFTKDFVDGCVSQILHMQNTKSELANTKREKQILSDLLHEIRNFNSQFKANCESIVIDDSRNQTKQELVILSNLAISQMITSRLEFVVYKLNPAQIQKERIRFYNKLNKVIKSSKAEAATKNVTLIISGSSTTEVLGYSFVDQIPAIMIQNAIKFSQPNTQIEISISDDFNNISCSVKNLGPHIHVEEREKVFQKNYRGKEAEGYAAGTGTGLWFLKQIVDIHLGSIQLEVGDPHKYGETLISSVKFTVKIPY